MRASLVASVAATLLALTPGPAEAKDVAESYQTWTSLTFQQNVAKRVAFYVDVNFRFYDDFHPFNQLYRPGIGYLLGDGMTFYVAYAWTPLWRDVVTKAADSDDGQDHRDHPYVDEHRLWQQFTADVPRLPRKLGVFLRSRVEERFRPELSSQVGLRARQFLRFLVPTVPGFPLRISVWDELFLALNTPTLTKDGAPWQVMGFDQNRFFVGPSLDVAKGTRVELGYFNQFQRQATAPADALRHVVMMNWFVTLD